ncbi:MAG: peptidoglycan-binding protein [Candidatus Diapherotrites archaeon]|nr:peptidoglycan-binding protein [Candidatus Diapherotrites archaeon]
MNPRWIAWTALAIVLTGALLWVHWSNPSTGFVTASARAFPVPPPEQVTRQTYLDYIKFTFEHKGWNEYLHSPPFDPNTNRYSGQYAGYVAFWASALQDNESFLGRTKEDYARDALRLMRGDYNYLLTPDGSGKLPTGRFNYTLIAAQNYLYLKDNEALTPEDHAFMHAYLLLVDSRAGELEYGSFNRSFDRALGQRMLYYLFPDDPLAPQWKAYSDRVWNEFWENGDTLENASSYNSIWLKDLYVWLRIQEQFEPSKPASLFYNDPKMKRILTRYLFQLGPQGLMPAYGDTTGPAPSPAQAIGIFEAAGAQYRDGRFKFAAHRLFTWYVPQYDEMAEWGNIISNNMVDMMDSYWVVDDSFSEQMPLESSVVTMRKGIDLDVASASDSEVNANDVPDKVVFRSGWTATDLFALMETSNPAGHGHCDTGSLNFLSDNDTMLLGDTSYLVKDHRFHNTLQIVPKTGDVPPCFGASYLSATPAVPEFFDHPSATYAHLSVYPYMTEPGTFDRRVFFFKNDFVWVRDSLSARQSLEVTTGPAWNTYSILSNGTNWVDTTFQNIPVSYIFDLKYLMHWQNGAQQLLMLFPSLNGSLQTDNVTIDHTLRNYNTPLQNNANWRIWQKKEVQLAQGQSVFFDSVLVPHPASATAAGIGTAYSIAYDDPNAAVLQKNESGGAVFFAGINDNGRLLAFPAASPRIKTDAKQFWVRLRSGEPSEFWLVNASTLTIDGTNVFSSPNRVTVDSDSPGLKATEMFDISVTSNGNGLITPHGHVPAARGDTVSFSIGAFAGSKIGDVRVDGNSVGPVFSYAFVAVDSNHTLAADFVKSDKNTFSITAAPTEHGRVLPAGVTQLTEGENYTFRIIADAEYIVSNVWVDNNARGPLVQYSFSGIKANHSIRAEFRLIADSGPDSNHLSGPFAIGQTGPQVELLQRILRQDTYIYPEGILSGIYDDLTIAAVQRFQRKYNLISYGTPETTGFGLADAQTITKINEVFSPSGERPITPDENAPIIVCVSDWRCKEWMSCLNGTQNRSCTDTRLCAAPSSLPQESRACSDQLPTVALGGILIGVGVIVLLGLLGFIRLIHAMSSRGKKHEYE